MSARDYHRFMDAPAEAGFTTAEIRAAYGVGKSSISEWGMKRISKIGRQHVYKKADVLKAHGEPPQPPTRRRFFATKTNGNGEHKHIQQPDETLRVLYPIDVQRVQEAMRKELECTLAPLLNILAHHSVLLAELVQIEKAQLDLWQPRKKAA